MVVILSCNNNKDDIERDTCFVSRTAYNELTKFIPKLKPIA